MENLSYPIGRFETPVGYDASLVEDAILTISTLADDLESLLTQLSAAQLEQPYRPGGWTARQVFHHLADSHINAFVRCKLATTEDWPVARPYQEAAWAEQVDHQLPVEVSISIIRGIHKRWVALCKSLSVQELASNGYTHPEFGRKVPMWEVIPRYAWHCRHHLAHIRLVLD